MINQINENISCVLSGYELLVNIVNNHETQISNMRSSIANSIQPITKAIATYCIDSPISNQFNNLLSSSQVSIGAGANVDILCLSNVDTDDIELLYYNPPEENPQPLSDPKPSCSPQKNISKQTILSSFSGISEIASQVESDSLDQQSHSSTSTSCSAIATTFPVSCCDLNNLPYESFRMLNLFEDSKLDDSTVFTQ